MATFKYNNASAQFATAQFNWPAMTVKALLLSAGYAPALTDVHVSDIPAAAILGRSTSLTGMAQTNGVCRGTIPQLNSLVTAAPVIAIALYADTGNDTTSQLIYYSSDGSGFPFLASGFNYDITYDQIAGGWFVV